MSDLPPLPMSTLKSRLESGNLAKGVKLYDDSKVLHPSRRETKLYGEVAGSGKSNYKVTIELKEDGTDFEKASCSCPAARFQGRGPCKHASALLVAWSSAPEGFVEAEEPSVEAAPTSGGGGGKKKSTKPKKGKVDTAAAVTKGVEALEALLVEVSNTGVSTLTQERVHQIREMATNLKALKLRRLSPATLKLSEMLQASIEGNEEFRVADLAAQLTTITFHMRGLARLMKRDDPDAEDYRRLEDELLGKTWHDKRLTSVSGLRMLDLGYRKELTADNFVLEESFLADVATGEVYTEKMIRPPNIAKRGQPKEQYHHDILEISNGGLYPGFAPRRIKLREFETRAPEDDDIDALVQSAPDTAKAIYEAYHRHRSDVFAPRYCHVTYRPQSLVVQDDALLAVDGSGEGVRLRLDSTQMDMLLDASELGSLNLIYGTVGLSDTGLELKPRTVIHGSGKTAAVTSFMRRS